MPLPDSPPAEAGETRRPGTLALFLGHAKIGLLGFGGVNALARHVIVVERCWLGERDYAETLGLGQVLPGPNIGNTAVMIGRRLGGARGALAATLGLYSGPIAVLLLLAGLWEAHGHHPVARGALAGAAAAAAGMVLGNALRMTARLRLPAALLAVAALAALAGAWWRLPLPLILAGLGPPAVWLAWRRPA